MKQLIIFTFCWLTYSAWGETDIPLNKIDIATDLPTIARGAESVMTVCNVCHGLKYIRFRDLTKIGLEKSKVDSWRGTNPMGAAIAGQMAADAALTAFGSMPPDLSLIAKAREGNERYIYSYLLGFYYTPEGSTSNHYFPTTKMPDVLGVSGITDPAQLAELKVKAREIASFLAWTADPHAQERQSLGYYVICYLLILTIMLYILKKRIWAKLDNIK